MRCVTVRGLTIIVARHLEVLNDAMQDLDAHLQLHERQIPVAGDQVVIDGKRLVHLREQDPVVPG